MAAEGVATGELVLDPFSGGGTVPLAAVEEGLEAEAVEVNPFLRFVTATKLCQVGAEGFTRAADAVLVAMSRPVRSPLEGYSTFTEGNRWGRWLFSLSVLRAFEAGRQAVGERGSSGERALLKLALLGAVMDCCNASRDGKCLRFRPNWMVEEATAQRARERFEVRAGIIARDLKEAPLGGARAVVVEGDARRVLGRRSRRFRVCITSPPYLNSFDYSDVYRPELFLGEFIASTDELRKIRLRALRSHVQASWKRPKKDDFGVIYRECMERVRDERSRLWDGRLAMMIQAYFEDMESVLRLLKRRARADGSLWMVVSTSAYAGVEIPVDLIIAEVGQRVGWFLRDVGVLRYLRSSSQHIGRAGEEGKTVGRLRESVVIFDAAVR